MLVFAWRRKHYKNSGFGHSGPKKIRHAKFGPFLLVFFDRFWASLVSTLLEVFITDCPQKPVFGRSRETGSFEAFLVHVPETPIKRVQRGIGYRGFKSHVPQTPIKLVGRIFPTHDPKKQRIFPQRSLHSDDGFLNFRPHAFTLCQSLFGLLFAHGNRQVASSYPFPFHASGFKSDAT